MLFEREKRITTKLQEEIYQSQRNGEPITRIFLDDKEFQQLKQEIAPFTSYDNEQGYPPSFMGIPVTISPNFTNI